MRLITLLAVTVILCGCISDTDQRPEAATTTIRAATTTTLPEPTEALKAAMEDCDSRKVGREECYLKVFTTKKSGDCASLQPRTDWEGQCNLYFARRTNKSEFCDRIKTADALVDMCYQEIAERTGNLTLCEKVMYESGREYCRSVVAEKLNNRSTCGLIKNLGDREYCILYSEGPLDVKTCDAMATVYYRDQCYIMALGSEYDPRLCDRIQSESTREFCRFSLKPEDKSPELCGGMVNPYYKDSCYRDVGAMANDPSMCGKILGQDKADECNNKVATALNDTSICGRIRQVGLRDMCYSTVGEALSDSRICDLIKNVSAWADDCYMAVAVGNADEKTCTKIKNKDLREECVRQVNEKPSGQVDISAFLESGCVLREDYGQEILDCNKTGLESEYSCFRIIKPSDHLAQLTPKSSIAECEFWIRNWPEGEYITHKGCMGPLGSKYIVGVDGGFTEIATKDEFRNFFAPVESPEEALAFAVALTGSYPQYNVTIPEGYTVLEPNPKPTSVDKVDGGYTIRLFDYVKCGCGQHPRYAVEYLVTEAGEVNETSRESIYELPKGMTLCVD